MEKDRQQAKCYQVLQRNLEAATRTKKIPGSFLLDVAFHSFIQTDQSTPALCRRLALSARA